MASLALVAAAIAVQLVPLPQSVVDTISPQARTLLREQSLPFRTNAPSFYPLTINPSRTQLGLAFFGAFSLLLVGTGRVLTRRAANGLAAAVAVVGVILAIAAMVQNATFNGKIYGFWTPLHGGTPYGPFVNKNHFAGWMLMAIPVVIGYFLARTSSIEPQHRAGFRDAVLWFSTERGGRAVMAAFAAIVMALSLVLTMSRSGMTGLVLAFGVTSIFVARREGRAVTRGLVFAYFGFTALTIVLWAGVDQIMTRFSQIDVSAIDQRPAIWADTVRIVRDFWLTGTGLNTFSVSVLHYQTSVPNQYLREAHSDYLQLAAEGGLLLGIPVALSILVFCGQVRKRLREDTGSIRWIRMGALTGLIAIAFQSLVEFSLQMPGNAALFAVIAGLAIHDGHRV